MRGFNRIALSEFSDNAQSSPELATGLLEIQMLVRNSIDDCAASTTFADRQI